jgi:hypothetical protein
MFWPNHGVWRLDDISKIDSTRRMRIVELHVSDIAVDGRGGARARHLLSAPSFAKEKGADGFPSAPILPFRLGYLALAGWP